MDTKGRFVDYAADALHPGYCRREELDGGRAQTLLGGGVSHVGYRIAPAAILHPKASMLVGAGGISTGDAQGAGNEDDAFFIAEPALGLEMNVASFLRASVWERATAGPPVSTCVGCGTRT